MPGREHVNLAPYAAAASDKELLRWRAEGLAACLAARHGSLVFFQNDDSAVTQSLLQYGEWAENEISFLRRFIAPGSAVIDVGAYIGTHALAFAREVGPDGSVFAIEPQPPSYRLLCENVRLNGAERIFPINAAAGAASGTVCLTEIDIGDRASFGSVGIPALTAMEPTKHIGTREIPIRTIALDSLPVTSCALLKIDVEGGEHLVLDGAQGLIRTWRPIVYAECNSVENGHKILRRLEWHGYRAMLHVSEPFNVHNWKRNPSNIFGAAREVALVGIPPERFGATMLSGSSENLFEINTLDDLVAGMLKKPQYPYEVLMRTSAVKQTGTGFWHALEEAEQEAAAAKRQAEQERVEAVAAHREASALKREAEQAAEEARCWREEAGVVRLALETLRGYAASREEYVKRVQAEAATARDEADAASAALAIAQKDLSHALTRAEQANARLQAIVASTSWRVTAPIRAAMDLLWARRGGVESAPSNARRQLAGIGSYIASRSIYPLRLVGSKLPRPLRVAARRVLRPAWWAVALQLHPQTHERGQSNEDRQLLLDSDLFQREWYVAQYPEVAACEIDPVLHYLRTGADEGRNPGPKFCTRAYVMKYEDVAECGMNPLVHYLRYGRAEGRQISPAPSSPVAMADAQPPRVRLVYVSAEWGTPGNVYRVTRYVEAAQSIGAAASWVRLDQVEAHLDEIAEADIVVLWRTAWDQSVEAVIAAARRGCARLVFDVDDLMVEPDIARISVIDGIRTGPLTEEVVRGHFTRVRQAMLAADLCTATTEELARYMRAALKPAHVLPNGFDTAALQDSRLAVRKRRAKSPVRLIRIGYAGGTPTHQRDFGLAAVPVARVLQERSECRLVLFRNPASGAACVDIDEYPELAVRRHQIEWRDLVPLDRLPEEIARFDVNLAPLELGNPFCEAKSELKYFEAALVDVVTIASPTGPFLRAIEHGETGFLAESEAAWYSAILAVVDNPALRRRMVRAARNDVMRRFGPLRRSELIADFITQVRGGTEGAHAFAAKAQRARLSEPALPGVSEAEPAFLADRLGAAEVTVVLLLHDDENLIVPALESVHAQTLETIDLVVVENAAADSSLAAAIEWAQNNAERFNRLLVLRKLAAAGLGPSRNTGFDAAETPYVLPLAADNRLLPDCCEALLDALRGTDAAFAYPAMRRFGGTASSIGVLAYDPHRLIGGNFIDAPALVAKEAWAAVGGYDNVSNGWEEYEFWCRIAERGLRGTHVARELIEDRVHGTSIGRTTAPIDDPGVLEHIRRRHPWLGSAFDRSTTAGADVARRA